MWNTIPESVIVRIFQYLDYSGRGCLALTSKHNARTAVEHHLLESSKSCDELEEAMDNFFLLCDRDHPDLKFCTECGLYRSRKKEFWQKRALAQANKIGGRQALRWRREIARTGVEPAISAWVRPDPIVTSVGLICRVCPDCILRQYSGHMMQIPH